MSRVYKIGEKAYPSVTSILSVIAKPGLAVWQQNLSLKYFNEQLYSAYNSIDQPHSDTLGNKDWLDNLMKEAKGHPQSYTTKAATLGSRAHQAFEDICCGKEVQPDEDIIPLVEAFMNWKESEPDLQIIEVEKVLYSEKYGYAGTVDAIGARTGSDSYGIVILDWKTSNSLHPEYAMQVSAYAKAWEELHDSPGAVKEAHVVRFDKYKPKYEAKQVYSIEESFKSFLSCLNIYKAQKNNKHFV